MHGAITQGRSKRCMRDDENAVAHEVNN
jgi:hypothetical protein